MTAPTLEYKQGIGIGEDSWGKPLAFPRFTKFSELFSEWRLWVHNESKKYPQDHGVDDYCLALRTDLEDSLHVKARTGVVEWVNANMIRSDYDSWYFELVQRGDGLLVVVKNNQILASRWLALLDAESVIAEIRAGL